MKHPVYDCDTSFEINAATRVVTNTSTNKTTLVQGDHNSERFTFTLPREIEGHDMSLCDRVEVHYNNIENQTLLTSSGVYLVEDCAVCSDDDTKVNCTWLISGNATKYAGKLEFVVRFICNDAEGNLSYAWDTAIHSGITVSKGIYNGEAVGEMVPDIILQWKDDLKGERGYSVYDAGISMSLAEQPQVGDEITINYGGCEPGDFLICKINDRETGLPLRTVLLEVIEKDTTTPQPNVYKCTVSAIVGGEVILSCSTEFEFTSEPTSGYESGGVETSTFNKKPIDGDTFLMSGLYGGQHYLCTCSVRDLFADNTLVSFTVLSAMPIGGLAALECNYVHESTELPSTKIGMQISFDGTQEFNRTPVGGDFFQLIWTHTPTGNRYGVWAMFAWQGGTVPTFYVQDSWTLGAKGNDGVDGSEYYDVNLDYACPEDLPTEGTTKYTYVKRYGAQREPKAGDLFCFNYTGVNSKGQSKIINVITRTGSIANGTITTGFKPLYFAEGVDGTLYYTKSIDGTCPDTLDIGTGGSNYVITKREDQRLPRVGDFVVSIYSTPNVYGQKVVVRQLTTVTSSSVAGDNTTVTISGYGYRNLYFADGKAGTLYKHKIAFKNDDNESWYCEWISPSSTPVTDSSTFYYFRDNAIQAGISYKWGNNGSSSVPKAIGGNAYLPYPGATYIYTDALVVSDAAVSWDTTARFEFTSITDTVTALTN